MSLESLTFYLPAELHYHMLTFLDVRSLVAVRSLNTYWRELADIDSLWKKFVEEVSPLGLAFKSELDYKIIYKELVSLGFDSVACGKNITLSESNFAATKADDHKYATVLGSKKLVAPESDDVPCNGVSSGRFYWEITITNMQLSGCLCVGVVNDRNAINFPSESHGMFGHFPHGWGLFSDGERCHNATWYRPAYSSFTTGDTVGVLVEFTDEDNAEEPEAKIRRTGGVDEILKKEKTATISFFINKVPQGVAFKGVKGPLYPAFAIKRKGEGVKLNVAATLEFLVAEKQRLRQIQLHQKQQQQLVHQQQQIHKELQLDSLMPISVAAFCP